MSLLKEKKCDFCGCKPPVIIDGCTKGGPWAWMCEECWSRYGLFDTFGVGKAQSFVNEDDGPKLQG